MASEDPGGLKKTAYSGIPSSKSYSVSEPLCRITNGELCTELESSITGGTLLLLVDCTTDESLVSHVLLLLCEVLSEDTLNGDGNPDLRLFRDVLPHGDLSLFLLESLCMSSPSSCLRGDLLRLRSLSGDR